MKKGKGENDRSSVKDSSGSGVRVNYKVVSIVVVVLLLLFLVFVFNRGGDSEDDGWGSLFSFRIDSDPFPFLLPDPEIEIEIDPGSDPESEYDPGCPREGDDEGLTQICNRAPEADDAENEFICCKESQECDTTDDGEPSCKENCPPDGGNPDLTTTCYGQQGTAGKDGIICCTEDQRCATNEDGEPTCVNSLPEGNYDYRCLNQNPRRPILCVINGAKFCCTEDQPYCLINEDGQYACGSFEHSCNDMSLDEGKTCCEADEGEEWICGAGTTCGPPGTRRCIKEGHHACEDNGVIYSCPKGMACCGGGCCLEGAICDYDNLRNKFYCNSHPNIL